MLEVLVQVVCVAIGATKAEEVSLELTNESKLSGRVPYQVETFDRAVL